MFFNSLIDYLNTNNVNVCNDIFTSADNTALNVVIDDNIIEFNISNSINEIIHLLISYAQNIKQLDINNKDLYDLQIMTFNEDLKYYNQFEDVNILIEFVDYQFLNNKELYIYIINEYLQQKNKTNKRRREEMIEEYNKRIKC